MLHRLLQRLRLRLGLLLLLLAALAVPLGLWVDGAHRQAAAVRWVESHQGSVHFQGEIDAEGVWLGPQPSPVPASIERVLGRDMFRSIIGVYLPLEEEAADGPEELDPFGWPRLVPRVMAPAELAHLEGIRSLTWIESEAYGFDDRHLAAIARLRKLEHLSVSLGTVTPHGLMHLAALPRLRQLEVGTPGIGARQLEAIGQCRALEDLTIHFDDASASLKPLASLRHLRTLSIVAPDWQGQGLNALPELTSLTKLYLHETAVGNREMSWVGRCAALETIWLGDYVTDAGLIQLQPLGRLRILRIFGPRITADGIRRFLSGSASLGERATETPLVLDLFGPNINPDELAELQRDFPGVKGLSGATGGPFR